MRRIAPDDAALMEPLPDMFDEAFDDLASYSTRRPSMDYQRKLLASDSFIALAAFRDREIVGGIAAYELKKLEQERTEIYIYDLAAAASYRREGIATVMIEGIEDEPAIALYTKMGVREDVLHFDIAVPE